MGVPLCEASTTAGKRLATAVPEDVMTTAGRLQREHLLVQKDSSHISSQRFWAAMCHGPMAGAQNNVA